MIFQRWNPIKGQRRFEEIDTTPHSTSFIGPKPKYPPMDILNCTEDSREEGRKFFANLQKTCKNSESEED